jgi:phosphoserine aminotransferase
MEGKTVHNFSAGPCCLPKEVLKTAQDELLDWHGSGVSVMEMSHRSKEFVSIAKKAEEDLRKLLNIPDNYKVFFLQGGASLAFTAICKNLMGENTKANYLVTGSWGKNAFKDAKLIGDANEVIKPLDSYTGCPDFSEWDVKDDAAFFHFCDNETIYGVEFNNFPYEELKNQELVVDMSSNFCTRPIDFTKYGVVYAGAQKNVGPAGVCITIVREDLLGKAMKDTTSMLDWQVTAKATDQFYNTPCCWSIYMCGLNIAYMLEKGLDKIEAEAVKKSGMLYTTIEGSGGYYTNPVDEGFKSRVNVPFRVKKDADLEKKFLVGAAEAGMIELKGHRSVGGCRASIYNAMGEEGVQALVDYMKKFQEENP